jgi:MAF protein
MLIDKIKNKKIILGSNSPRRKELLSGLGFDFTIDAKTDFIENQECGLNILDIAEFMAKGKSHGYHRQLSNNEILITADTVVIINNNFSNLKILGKPKDKKDAINMLQRLSGKSHIVITGVCIRDLNKEICFSVKSQVWFKELLEEEILYYIDNFKPYDKAGAYGIQEWIGYIGISKIEGSFYNIMRLPIQKIYQELHNFV